MSQRSTFSNRNAVLNFVQSSTAVSLVAFVHAFRCDPIIESWKTSPTLFGILSLCVWVRPGEKISENTGCSHLPSVFLYLPARVRYLLLQLLNLVVQLVHVVEEGEVLVLCFNECRNLTCSCRESGREHHQAPICMHNSISSKNYTCCVFYANI